MSRRSNSPCAASSRFVTKLVLGIHIGFSPTGAKLKLRVLALAATLVALISCVPGGENILAPIGDIAPPAIVRARQIDQALFEIEFNEDAKPIRNSFAFSPSSTCIVPAAESMKISISFSPPIPPGTECLLSGEAEDNSGNTTRFLLSFTGYNPRPARLMLNEVQTGKNSSTLDPHRDYLEFVVQEKGNLGGVQAQWASSVKIMDYFFPPCEVGLGEILVLHCAPEGISAEKDETAGELALSGGIDSSPTGRDFWTSAGGLPDETGLILLRNRIGEAPIDALFYAGIDKTGDVEAAKLCGLIQEMEEAGLWKIASPPRWEDAFLWKSSPSRPLHRIESAVSGAEEWRVGDSGSQSPGLLLAKSSPGPKHSKK
jgi:hypothetical protein